MPTRTAIINADDFGFTPGVTRGIVHAFREGVLTSTTAMVNSEIMCHSGYVDEGLLASGDEYTAQREKELAVLLDPRVRDAMERFGIQKTSFKNRPGESL